MGVDQKDPNTSSSHGVSECRKYILRPWLNLQLKSHNQNQEGEVITNVNLEQPKSVSLQNADYITSLHNSVINQ